MIEVIGGSDPHRVAGIVALVLQHALAELRAGGVPRELVELDTFVGIDARTPVIARDIGPDLGPEIGLHGIDQQAAGAQDLRHLHHAFVHSRQVVAQRLQRRIGGA